MCDAERRISCDAPRRMPFWTLCVLVRPERRDLHSRWSLRHERCLGWHVQNEKHQKIRSSRA